MNQRIKEIRKKAGLTQQDFAERIGSARNTIANYEIGNRNPSDAVIRSICREFSINEEWLRTGKGFMKNAVPDSLMEKLRETYHLSDLEYRILEKHFALPDSQRDQVREFIQELFETEEVKPDVLTRMIAYYGRLASAGAGQVIFEDFPTEFIEIDNTQENRRVIYAIGVNGDSMEPALSDSDILLIEQACDVEIGEIGIFVIDGEAFVKKRGSEKLISINPEYPDIPLSGSARCMGRVAGVIRE